MTNSKEKRSGAADPARQPQSVQRSRTGATAAGTCCALRKNTPGGEIPRETGPAPAPNGEPKPAQAEATLKEGIELAKAGQLHEALYQLKRAQELFSGASAETETRMGFIHEELNNYAEALKHHSNAVRLEDNAHNRLNRATTLMEANDLNAAAADATAALERRTETSPGYHSEAEANWILAIFEQEEGNLADALEHAQTARSVAGANGYAKEQTEELDELVANLTASIENARRIAQEERTAPPKIAVETETTRLAELQNGRWLRQRHPSIARKIEALPWMNDGMNPEEKKIVHELLFLYVENRSEQAISLLEMPFLQSIEPGDLQAVSSLTEVNRKSHAALNRIAHHPNFMPGGITNEWTPVISVLGAVEQNNPSLKEILLDRDQVTVESRTIRTSLSDEISLNIIRVGNRFQEESMNRLEEAVHYVESYTREPFPTKMVALLFADAVSPGTAGTNHGSSITILQEYDSNQRDANGINRP